VAAQRHEASSLMLSMTPGFGKRSTIPNGSGAEAGPSSMN
jgi:hypothetical protein